MKSPLPRLSAAFACLFAVALAACDDPNENTNLGSVFADTLTAYALTGTSPSFPSGYLAAAGAVTRADGNFNFDVAFDIDSANQVVVFPAAFRRRPARGPQTGRPAADPRSRSIRSAERPPAGTCSIPRSSLRPAKGS